MLYFIASLPKQFFFLATIFKQRSWEIFYSDYMPRLHQVLTIHLTNQNYAQFFCEKEKDLQSQIPTRWCLHLCQPRSLSRKLHDDTRPCHNHKGPATFSLFFPARLVLTSFSHDLINFKSSVLLIAELIPLHLKILPNLFCNIRIKVRLEKP